MFIDSFGFPSIHFLDFVDAIIHLSIYVCSALRFSLERIFSFLFWMVHDVYSAFVPESTGNAPEKTS